MPITNTRHVDSAATAPARVLLAIAGHRRSSIAARRAASVARALHAELHVVCVLREERGTSLRRRQRNLLRSIRAAEQASQARRATRAWLRSCLGDHDALDRVVVARGAFVEAVSDHVAALAATLVVVPAGRCRLGGAFASLVSASRVPVLVARPSTADPTIVAATDLESPAFPVLREAAEFGRRLGVPVVAVHNLDPIEPANEPQGREKPLPLPRAVPAAEPARAARARLLARASEVLPSAGLAVLRSDLDPVDAILREARTHDADLVVVGAHCRSRLDRFFRASVAVEVVNRARRSVLVTPIECAGEADGVAARCA